MSDPSHPTPKALPRWIVVVVSVGVFLHLSAIAVRVLAVRSGPWVVPPPVGVTMCEPPTFVSPIAKIVLPAYIEPLRLDNNYHFQTNRPEVVDVAFEIRIKDKYGAVTRRWFPDPEANFAVRFRQSLLAQGLAEDVEVKLGRMEVIAAQKQKVPEVKYWDRNPKDTEMRLETRNQNAAPKDRELFRPSEWSEVLAKSYMRYLLRTTEGARSAELVRIVKGTVLPDNLFIPRPMEGTFEPTAANFGEVKP